MRQPDIEIYLREDHLDNFFQWLNQHIGVLHLDPWSGATRRGTLQNGQTPIPLMIVRKAAGKWASVWFISEYTPWSTDLECARAIAAGLQVEVRCSVGTWEESQGDADADRWMKVTATEEDEFVWAQ